MKLANNTFTRALKQGDKQFGLWVTLSSPFAAEVTAPAGYDWALIDMEHSPNDYFSVLGQLQTFANTDTTAIVRPEWNDPVIVKRLLDMGVEGLLFPMIQSLEDAQKAVAATRYPPHGTRGFSGGTRATKFGRVTDYLARVEDETTVILQLETAAAIAQAVEIGTGEIPGVMGNAQLRLYEKLGFVRDGVLKGFFSRYPIPIIENGHLLRDMVMLRQEL